MNGGLMKEKQQQESNWHDVRYAQWSYNYASIGNQAKQGYTPGKQIGNLPTEKFSSCKCANLKK